MIRLLPSLRPFPSDAPEEDGDEFTGRIPARVVLLAALAGLSLLALVLAMLWWWL